MGSEKRGDRRSSALIKANEEHLIEAGLAADRGQDQHDRLHAYGARGPPWWELKRVAPLREAEQFLSVHRDTLIRNHRHLLVRLSKRRWGIRWESILAIANGTADAA
jgi:hypothetical protein